MSYLSDLKKQYDRLGAEIAKLEAEPKLWPQCSDVYWYVDLEGGESYAVFDDFFIIHQQRLATGNCYRTEAEARAYREWQTDPRVVARGMIERMEGFDPEGEVSVGFDSSDDGIVYQMCEPFECALQFKNEKYIDSVLDKLGEDLIKVALGVITDKEEGSRIVREAMGK